MCMLPLAWAIAWYLELKRLDRTANRKRPAHSVALRSPINCKHLTAPFSEPEYMQDDPYTDSVSAKDQQAKLDHKTTQ